MSIRAVTQSVKYAIVLYDFRRAIIQIIHHFIFLRGDFSRRGQSFVTCGSQLIIHHSSFIIFPFTTFIARLYQRHCADNVCILRGVSSSAGSSTLQPADL
jgi:hypothetical protein